MPLLLKTVDAEVSARRFTEAAEHLRRAAAVLEEHGQTDEALDCRERAASFASAS